MGYTSWFRAFSLAHFVSFFPLALSFTFVASGRAGSAGTFMWLEKNWAGYMGWITSTVNVILAGLMISGRWDSDYVQSIWKAP